MNSINIQQLTPEEMDKKHVRDWPIWEKEVSEFNWNYNSEEQCLFLEGEVDIETPGGVVNVKKGDFVTFPRGLSCVWRIKEPVKKHYKLG